MVSKKWMRVTTYWVKPSIRMRNSSIKRTNNIHHRTVLGLFFKNLGGLGVLKDGEGRVCQEPEQHGQKLSGRKVQYMFGEG